MKIRIKIVAAIALAVVAGGLYTGLRSQPVAAQSQGIQDCSTNSIIKCGVNTPAELISKVRANNPADLTAIYDNFDLNSQAYDAFARDAKWGTAKQDGTIVYNGQVVARNAWSIGREAKPYSTRYAISGTTYHKSKSTDVLKQDLPVMLWFDQNGELAGAILAACGNPMGGETVKPSYRCQQINKETVSGQANTYRFTANAPASNGATISRVVYNFGDGSPEQTRTSPTDAVTHTYTNPGNYTAKVTIYFRLPSGQEVSASGNGCDTPITVSQPQQPLAANWQCTQLQAIRRDGADVYAYTFRADASLQNARLVSADFAFGDGATSNAVQPTATAATTIQADHTYAAAGTYRATATLRFEATNGANAQGKDANVTCSTELTITAPAPAPQPALPAAGPAGIAGLFAGSSALGALGYRWHARRRLSKVDDFVDKLIQR